jgi:hypothetical protein
MWGTKFAVNYDKTKVELQGYTLGDVFNASEVTAPEYFDNGRYVFFASRSDFTDTTTVGKFVTLSFKTKDGENLTDYPVSLDTSVAQSINTESSIISFSVDTNAPKISVSGNTRAVAKQDKAVIAISTGTSTLTTVSVKKDDGNYTDITESYQNGYTVTENGTYTFKLVTASGETATSAIVYSKIDSVKPIVVINANGYTAGSWTKGEVTLSPSNTAQNIGTTAFMYKVGSGGWITYTAPIVVSNETGEITYSFKAMSEAGIESDVKTIVVKRDKALPDGDIKIGSNSIKKALNTITFGLFFKDTQTVTVTALDSESGIAKIEYYIANEKVEDVLSISDWKEYTSTIDLNPSSQYVIYVRITDKVGNSVIINSDGIVIENVVPVITGVTDGTVYCVAQTVTVSDDNLDTVKLNGSTVALQDGKIVVSPQNGDQTVTATDKSGNVATVKFTVNSDHTWDEGIITTEPTAAAEGVKTHNCLHCGETKTESVDKLSPVIIYGQQSTWQQGSNVGLTFRSDAAFTDFIGVLVDNKIIDSKHYDVKDGSIIVTLKADYLATLPSGKHALGIQSGTGTAYAEFLIVGKIPDKKPEDTKPPLTGNDSNILLLLALFFVSGGNATVLSIKGRKIKA